MIIKYKTISLRTWQGFKEAETMILNGWQVGSVGFARRPEKALFKIRFLGSFNIDSQNIPTPITSTIKIMMIPGPLNFS